LELAACAKPNSGSKLKMKNIATLMNLFKPDNKDLTALLFSLMQVLNVQILMLYIVFIMRIINFL
jgi:hypothetical protein